MVLEKKRAAEPAKKKTPAATQPKKSGIGMLNCGFSFACTVFLFFREPVWILEAGKGQGQYLFA